MLSSHRRPWPRYLYRCRRFSEVTCDEDRVLLFRWTATAAERPPICLQTRVPVTSSISRSDTAEPRQCHPCRNPAVPAEAAPVGDELGCPAGVFSSRYDHITPLHRQLHWRRRELIEVHACCPCVQVPTWSSTAVHCWWTLPVGGFQRATSPSFSIVIITGRPPSAPVDHRRQSFSSRRPAARVERSTTARNIRSVSVHIPPSSEDSLFQRCFPSLLFVVPEQWLCLFRTR